MNLKMIIKMKNDEGFANLISYVKINYVMIIVDIMTIYMLNAFNQQMMKKMNILVYGQINVHDEVMIIFKLFIKLLRGFEHLIKIL